MQNRKKVNKEIERKKRNHRRMSNLIVGVVIAIVVLGLSWIGWDVYRRSYVMTLDGQRISTSELHVHAFMNGIHDLSDPETLDFAIEQLVSHRAMMQQAEDAGLSITTEEREQAREIVAANREWWGLPNAAPTNVTAEILAERDFLIDQVFEHFVPPYTPNPGEHEEELEQYIENSRFQYEVNRTEAQFIMNEDRAVLDNIKELMATDSADFEEFIRTYCITYSPEVDIEFMAINDIINSFGLFEHFFTLQELQAGETSDVIESDGVYLLVYMQNRPSVTDAEIEESFFERIADERRRETFTELRQSWTDAASFTLNQRAINAL